MRTVLVAVVLPLAAAGCAYKPGSFHSATGPFSGETRTVGCLDVAVTTGSDAYASGPVVRYQFGNRCDAPALVDLGAVQVTARYGDGRRVELRPYDPDHEIRPLPLEARRHGGESLEYVPAAWSQAEAEDLGPVAELCLDLARLDADEPRDRPEILCLQPQSPAAREARR